MSKLKLLDSLLQEVCIKRASGLLSLFRTEESPQGEKKVFIVSQLRGVVKLGNIKNRKFYF